MFSHPEDIMLSKEHAWQGSAIGWLNSVNPYIYKLPVISQWFCGVRYKHENNTILSYSVYMPTSGKDNEFCEVLQTLTEDIETHMTNGYMLIIGLDSNQSVKSSRRRTYEMQNFIDKFSLKTILENNTDPTFHHYNGSESQIDHIYHNLENKDNC